MIPEEKIFLVLQARTNSARLPAKVLLPINGVPIVVLAAKRAMNTGLPLVVATSEAETDDSLVNLLSDYDIPYFRGSLDNVLSRFTGALENKPSSTIVVRLTADNVFPDGQFIEKIVHKFCSEKLDYLCTTGAESGLPYGLSVEVTRLKHLQKAQEQTTLNTDLEHVTPYIRRKFGTTIYCDDYNLETKNLRCTIDCFDDYINVQEVFSSVDYTEKVSVDDLLLKLKNNNPKIIVKNTELEYPYLVLGAAQLGLTYGIANKLGKPSFSVAEDILKTAIENGVSYIDTARAYGESEATISQLYDSGWSGRFNLITKLIPISDNNQDVNDKKYIYSLAKLSVLESLVQLKTQHIGTLLLHRAADMRYCDGAVWECLVDLKQQNIIGKLGVSVQTPEELKFCLKNTDVEHIQLPFNLLDSRWESISNEILEIKKERELTIHVRSTYLQGLLLTDDQKLWQRAHVDQPQNLTSWLSGLMTQFGRESIADLCVAYTRGQPWIDGLVLGMDSEQQLLENIALFERSPLTWDDVRKIDQCRPEVSEKTINPAMWRQE